MKIVHMDYAWQNVGNLVQIIDELAVQALVMSFELIFVDVLRMMNVVIHHTDHRMQEMLLLDVDNDLVLVLEYRHVEQAVERS